MEIEEELLQQAHTEADAIVAEAREQARQLIEAAEARRAGTSPEAIREAGEQLVEGIQSAIQELTGVLEELRKRLA